ncbi:MAG: hypothetical protein F4X74_09230 [Acidimicrobiia bacterium]|nr:hypothetical protein [Acidimicrobiia bacterium]
MPAPLRKGWFVALVAVALVACGGGGGEPSVEEDIPPVPPPYFIAVGSGVLTSSDGADWTRIVWAEGDGTLNLTGAASGNGRLAVVGLEGSIGASDEAGGWMVIERDPGAFFGASDVAFGAGRFVAVGEEFNPDFGLQAVIRTSPDGVEWSQVDSGRPGLAAVTHGKGMFVAAGAGFVATSADGIAWAPSPFDASRQLFAIAYGDDRFVITGGHGSVFTSSDGVEWTSRDSGVSGVTFLRGVAHGGGLFVAVGDEYDATAKRSVSTIITSTDGADWTVRHSGASQSLSDVAYGDGTFVVIGRHETTDENGNVTSAVPIALTSRDGTAWETVEIAEDIWLNGVAYRPAAN